MTKYNEDEKPHLLIIHGKYEDEVDWTVEHLDDCTKEEHVGGMFDDIEGTVTVYTCRLQAVIDGNSLDDIEDWRNLPLGEYKIKSYYQYYPGEFGGEYGAEHEIGLFLVPE